MLRTFKLKSSANHSKTQQIADVLKEYRKTAEKIANFQWNYFFKE